MRALIYIILLIGNLTFSQDVRFSHLEKHRDTLYYAESGEVNYNIPSVNEFNIKGSSFNVIKNNRISLIKKYPYENPPDAIIVFQVFSKNVEELKIRDQATRTVIFKMNPKGGYHNIEAALADSDTKLLTEIKEINVEVIKKDPGKEAICEMKNLFIASTEIRKREFVPNVLSGKSSGRAYDSYGLYKSYPAFDREEDNKGTLYFGLKNDRSGYRSIERLMDMIEKNYPFEPAGRMNRGIIKKADTVGGLCSYISGIDRYIRQKYNDPHFSVRINGCKGKNRSTAILLYRLKKDYKVSAILDDSLKNKLFLEETVISIDGTQVRKLSPEQANALLMKEAGEISKLELKNLKGELRTVAYTHRDSYKIPPNFVQKTEFVTLNDEVAYLRIKHIDQEALYIFLENLQEIRSRKKLVLDLRNNGGGDFLTGAQILSLFIPEEFTYYQLKDRFSGKTGEIIVNKNLSDHRIAGIPEIRVLVNKNTSCVSELLAYDLKKYLKGTRIIGTEATAGALATLYEVLLESNSNIKFRTNALARSVIMLDHKSIEGRGISPDIHVNIRAIKDLQPYHDKVLITAISK